jgi:hypothetical protein
MERELARAEARALEAYSEEFARHQGAANLNFDPRERQALIENSEEVFIGKVKRLAARADNDPIPFMEGWSPTARYAVEI